jgi:ribulose-phosphate 3-epimerase
MTTISPSILSCDFMNIEAELAHFKDVPDLWMHLDVMDGHFVPNLTFGPPIIRMIAKKTKVPLDAHFMVTNPEFYIDDLKGAGVHNFTFHAEAATELARLVDKAKGVFPSVGLSLRPKTPVDAIPLDVYKKIDLLLVMSVEPGFGGQSFIEGTYDKLDAVQALKKKHGLSFVVQVDGGVVDKNAAKLRQHGAGNLVAGSFVFKGGPKEYKQRIEALRA